MAPNPEYDFESKESAPALGAEDARLESAGGSKTVPGRSEAAFMLLLGLTFILAGMALSVGPKLFWKVDQVSRGLAYLGVHGGTLLIGGVTLAGLALLRRAQIQAAAAREQPGDDQLILEHMAADMIQVRNSVDQLARCVDEIDSKVAHVSKDVRDLEFKLRKPEQEARPEPAIDEGQKDAIYRLAASVDHVGARIDHRLKSQYEALQQRLADISANITEAHKRGDPPAAVPAMPATEDPFEDLLSDDRVITALEDLRRAREKA